MLGHLIHLKEEVSKLLLASESINHIVWSMSCLRDVEGLPKELALAVVILPLPRCPCEALGDAQSG